MPATLSGSIVDTSGVGLANVAVTLTGSSGSVTVYTDCNGHFIFPDVAPGTYSLSETAPPGYIDLSSSAGSAGGSLTAVISPGSI